VSAPLQSVWVTGENLISGSGVFKLLANRSPTQISLGRTIESFEEVLEDKVVCMTLESGVQIVELWSDPKLWSL